METMIKASRFLLGEKDFSSFRASGCQSKTPMRNVREIKIIKKKIQLFLRYLQMLFYLI